MKNLIFWYYIFNVAFELTCLFFPRLLPVTPEVIGGPIVVESEGGTGSPIKVGPGGREDVMFDVDILVSGRMEATVTTP